ncbi:MAG: DUF2283 domain-containing protein [Deinococcota bacterium]
MTLKLDTAADALYIRLSDTQVSETLELGPSMYVDVDELGHVVGIEVLNYSNHEQLEIPGFTMPASLDDARAFSAQFV